MAVSSKSHKRRDFLIKKDFQARFIMHFFLLVIMGGFTSTGLLFLLSSGNLTSNFNNSHLSVKDTAIYLLPPIIYTNLVTMIIISCALIAVTLIISHKIAGPLFRFEKDVQLIAAGDLTHVIRLRRKDQLKRLSMDINQMTWQFNYKIVRIHQGLNQFLNTAAQHDVPDSLVQQIQELLEKVETEFRLMTDREFSSPVDTGTGSQIS